MKPLIVIALFATAFACDLGSPQTGLQIISIKYDSYPIDISIPLHESPIYCGYVEIWNTNVSYKFNVSRDPHDFPGPPAEMVWDYLIAIHDHNYSAKSSMLFSQQKMWPERVLLTLDGGRLHTLEFDKIVKEI